MAPIVLTLLQGAFLLLLYLFVWRTARAMVRDLRAAPQSAPAAAPSSAPSSAPSRPAPRPSQTSRSPRGTPGELVVHLPQGRPRVLRLSGGDVTFGRSQQSTVPLDDSYASERHARIYQDGGQWLVADLGSTNGTFLNKARLTTPTPIGPGDQVAIGKTTVEVRK